jgi:hypothetical protein
MTYEAAEHILDTYTLVEILELNELTEVDVLLLLLEEERIDLPEVLPVDLDD